jgi:hypothetical protein
MLTELLLEHFMRRDEFRYLGVNKMIILKRILYILVIKIVTELSWPRIVSNSGILW